MAVDYAKTQQQAAELKRLLENYTSQESEAAMCLRELRPMLDGVIAATAKLPVQEVACSWHFHWGEIRKFEDLEEAYSQFAFYAKGKDPKKLDAFSRRLESDKKFAARMLSPQLTWWEKVLSVWSRLTHWRKR